MEEAAAARSSPGCPFAVTRAAAIAASLATRKALESKSGVTLSHGSCISDDMAIEVRG
jgi:hypothetical protein